ncbi:MAG: hypothetical protein ACXAAI_05665 [Promethearchaeota archaeon]|jgi:chromosome segregation ATPase
MEWELKKQLETKDNLLKLKDEQVRTLENSLKLKDDQIQTLENSLKIKDEKVKTLEKTIELKDDEIRKLGLTSINKDVLNEKDEKIQSLEKELEILNAELLKSDEELESLNLENEKLKGAQESSNAAKIIDYTNVQITKAEILKKMRDILTKALSSVTIVVPSIEDLQELYLYEARVSVNMRIACSINPGIEEHSELLNEFESLDNISLRNYEAKDRYILTRDGEELLFGVIGVNEENNMVMHTRDPAHIKLLNDIAQRGWLQSRRI